MSITSSFFLLFLTSITTSVAMHACFLRERKGVEAFFSFFVHELKSQCWRRKTRWSVARLHSGGSKKERETWNDV